MIGRQVGNYRILLALSEDNLGTLYRGEHVAGGFPVTLRHFAGQFTDVQLISRFLEISRAATNLGHPGVWQVRESVWSGRNAFMVGEHITEADALDRILQREGRIMAELVVKLGWQLASTLGAAHSANIFHCRLDGDSVVCFADPAAPGGYRAKIMDFGVAAFLDTGTPKWSSQRVEAFGLPFYMPPEQCRAGIIDYRGDVYSLGALMYHMASGRPPLQGTSPEELASAHQFQAVPFTLQQLDPQTPPELDMMIGAMLAKDPAARPTMPQIAMELERIAKKYWTTPTAERTVQLDLRVGTPPPAETTDEEGDAPPRSMKVLLAALVLFIVGGGTLAVLQPWKKKTAVADPTPIEKPTPEATPDAGVAVKPPEPPKPPPPPPKEPTPAEKALADAKTALSEERWADATTAAKALQKLEPKNTDAAAILKAVKAEPQNKKLYDDFMKAAAEDDPAEGSKRLKKIPTDSIYFPKAERSYKQVKVNYVHVKKAEAKALADTRKCAKIDAIAKEVTQYFPDAGAEIEAIGKGCAAK